MVAGGRAERIRAALTTPGKGTELRRKLGSRAGDCQDLVWGKPGSARGPHARCSPVSDLSCLAAGVGLAEEGGGQGGGLPSWKRPCLIVPD